MRGTLETIVGAMFAGKTSELLKRILWAKHQNKKIIVIKPSIDDRYSNENNPRSLYRSLKSLEIGITMN